MPKSKSLLKILLALVSVVFVISSWSYVQAETMTLFSGLDGASICKKTETLRYFKTLSFDGRAGRAEIICVRSIPRESTFHRLSHKKDPYNDFWEIIYSQNLYPEKSLNWPVYL
jgi:hypothetical protein